VRESLDVASLGDRAIVQGQLDAEHRGLFPGDTLRLFVEAWDNAPTPHQGRSAEIALRLPSMEELRAEARAAARGVASAADPSPPRTGVERPDAGFGAGAQRNPDGQTAGRPDGRSGSQQSGR